MSRKHGAQSIRILIQHARWLEANGYKQQAASCKRQAASLTRQNYNVIISYKIKEKEMTDKEAITKIIEALELMTKRIKKIEKDVLKLCKQKKHLK